MKTYKNKEIQKEMMINGNNKHRHRYSLFAENGVIVRNLNRPCQWVYSISGCKSFPGGF
jgi:hypothetical protein